MPRNEFMDHPEDDDFDLQVIRDGAGNPIDIIKVPRSHPGKGEDEVQDQEVSAVEADPHMWPDATRSQLAELRRGPGATTTEAHIADLKD